MYNFQFYRKIFSSHVITFGQVNNDTHHNQRNSFAKYLGHSNISSYTVVR